MIILSLLLITTLSQGFSVNDNIDMGKFVFFDVATVSPPAQSELANVHHSESSSASADTSEQETPSEDSSKS